MTSVATFGKGVELPSDQLIPLRGCQILADIEELQQNVWVNYLRTVLTIFRPPLQAQRFSTRASTSSTFTSVASCPLCSLLPGPLASGWYGAAAGASSKFSSASFMIVSLLANVGSLYPSRQSPAESDSRLPTKISYHNLEVRENHPPRNLQQFDRASVFFFLPPS